MSSKAAPQAAAPTHRDVVLVALLAAVATFLLVLQLRHGGLLGTAPLGSGVSSLRAQSLRILRQMTFLEGGLLWVLAAVVALRGDWLARQGGLRLLELHAGPVLVVLLMLHVASMFFYFAPHEILSSDPAVTCDNAYHYYQVVAADRLLSRDHHLWGYDPYFMAGYPAGVIFDLDMKGAEIYCHLLRGFGLPYAFKSYIVLVFVLFPVVLYATGRLLGLPCTEALVGLGLGLFFWHWGRPLLGHFRWAGMHSYILASYLSVLALALGIHIFEMKSRRPLGVVALALLVAIACQVHPLSTVLLAPGCMVLYVGGFRRLAGRDHLILGLGLLLVLTANADWILPFWHFRHYKTASNFWFQFRGWPDIAFLYTRETSIIFSAITVLGVAGLVVLRRQRPFAALVLGTSAATYFLTAFYGARIPALANTEPGRYLVPFAMLLCMPGALALVPLLRRVQRLTGPRAMTVGLVCSASLTPFLSLADNRFYDVHRVSAHIAPQFMDLLRFLEQRTTPQARILFETPGGFYNHSDLFYGAHLQALVPLYTHREVIGGPYPVNFMRHAAVDFKNGELLDRRLRDWPATEFARFLANYNIGWVVCWSGPAQNYMEGRSEMARIGDFDRFRVYTVAHPPGFVLQGSGEVKADYNEIAVTAAAGDTLVLKYHWVESLRTTPPLPLDAMPVPGDPVGFIRVLPRGEKHFVIRNAY